jgi:phage terminase small subunit
VKRENVKDEPLKPAHEQFAQNYVANGGNGTKAAENAGFSSGVDGASAAVAASRLLRNDKVRERIKELESQSHVSTSEVVGTLASHMRGDVTDALPNDDENVKRLKASGVSHLIKKVKFDKETGKMTEIEFYDAQAAARTLGKYKGLEQAARENDADVSRKTTAVRDFIERAYKAAEDAGEPKSREEIARTLTGKRPDLAPYVPREWVM